MSEQELREGLRLAVAGEPALAFDPDVLLARAKQEIRRRRALFGAGAATAAVAVAAVAVPTLLGSPRGGGDSPGYGSGSPTDQCASDQAPAPQSPDLTVPVRPGISYPFTATEPPGKPTAFAVPQKPTELAVPEPTGSPVPTPSAPPQPTGKPCQLSGTAARSSSAKPFPWPPPNVKPRQYSMAELQQLAEDMRARLAVRFPEIVPRASDVSVDEVTSGEHPGKVTNGRLLDTFVHYTVESGRIAAAVAVVAPGSESSPEALCKVAGCTVLDGPNGTKLLVTKDSASLAISVSHYRADGSVVAVTGYNYDPAASEKRAVPRSQCLDESQLIELATDPELHL